MVSGQRGARRLGTSRLHGSEAPRRTWDPDRLRTVLLHERGRCRGIQGAVGRLMVPTARNVRPSLSNDPRDKLMAALNWYYGKMKRTAEYQRAPMYFDACLE